MRFDRLSQYLSPEPMLQRPNWVKAQAQSGFSTSTYAYARNNPLKYTDLTGLFSWRHECSASALHGGARGFVLSSDDVFGNRISTHGGAVGFDNPYNSACEDLAYMRRVDSWANTKNLQPQDYVAWLEVSDCWEELRAEVAEACKRERQGKAPLCEVPPDPNPNPQPRPPLGG